MFFSQSEKQGIRIIGDLVDSAGVVLSRELLEYILFYLENYCCY